MKRLLCLAALLCMLIGAASAEKTILLTFAGDCTLGGDEATRGKANSFDSVAAAMGTDCFFAAFREMFASDDATIINLEGVLADSTAGAKGTKNFRFRGAPAYAAILRDASVEVVTLANNHAEDYGEPGLESTKAALKAAGVQWIRREAYILVRKGYLRVALFGVDATGFRQMGKSICWEIARVKAEDEADVIIAVCHSGKEYVPRHYAVQANTATALVDAGADLVIGNHSHRINPIEYYNGKYICYSLGNFCFAGNSKPSDMSSFLFQQRFRVRDGQVTNAGFRIIPIRISSRTDRNDFIPTVLTKDTAIDSVITVLKSNGRKLDYAVEDYPLAWPEE